MRVTKSISLDTEADRDILRWLDAQSNASEAIRMAIRVYLGRGGVTLGDVYQAVRDLDRKLRCSVAVAPDTEDWEEPPEAARALETLGL